MRLPYPRRPRRNRLRPALALLAATVLAGGALTACSGGDGPEREVDAFLAGWRSGDLQAVGFVDPTGAKVPAADGVRDL
ncbi:hypothetical protein, partial [Nonomuraea sp. NPDC049141]|uniref:hypothetical protein n=1 Tax=Nonomuraea sp. NPDC049141 TaxID=3155500 RepID=UPI00340A805D